MFSSVIKFLMSNINFIIAYFLIAVLGLIISKFLVPLFALILMLGVAFLGLNFFITVSELIRDGAAAKSIKATFLRFDNTIVKKIFYLLLLFIGVYLVAHIPLVIYSMTPLKLKFAPVMEEHTFILAFFGLIATALSAFFRVFFLTATAAIIYFNNSMIDSIKISFNVIVKLRALWLIIILMFVLDALIPHLTENRLVIVYSDKILDFIASPFIFLMTFYYCKGLEGNSQTDKSSQEGLS